MEFRPGVTNPIFWYPQRPPRPERERIRRAVLERDNFTCQFCGHRACKFMNVHHINESETNDLRNLTTCCVACHAVQHIGRNLDLGTIEIWQSPEVPQVDIVRRTRQGVRRGKALTEVKRSLKLKRGPYPRNSLRYANDLLENIGTAPRAYLPAPLCAVFVKLKRWQLE